MLRLVFQELAYRKSSGVLTSLALAIAIGVFFAAPKLVSDYSHYSDGALEQLQIETKRELDSLHQSSQARLESMRTETDEELLHMQLEADQRLADLDKRTKQIMRELGFNLRIVHESTDMEKLVTEFVAHPMPQEYVDQLAQSPNVTKIAHIVATLKQRITVQDRTRFLIGFAPETTQTHVEQKRPMGFVIEPGTVYLGSIAGEGFEVDDTIEVLGAEFTVAQILPPQGAQNDDLLIGMHLEDAQRLLGMEGLITEIVALGCKCESIDRVNEIQEQLESVLPMTQVLELRVQAIAREDQRRLVTEHAKESMNDYLQRREAIVQQERTALDTHYRMEAQRHADLNEREQKHRESTLSVLDGISDFVTPLGILVASLLVGVLAWSNVQQRRFEIGLFRSLGKPTSAIIGLFLGRAIVLGLIGGLVGIAFGLAGVVMVSQQWHEVSFRWSAHSTALLLSAMAAGPVVGILASYLPMWFATRMDPAQLLTEEK